MYNTLSIGIYYPDEGMEVIKKQYEYLEKLWLKRYYTANPNMIRNKTAKM